VVLELLLVGAPKNEVDVELAVLPKMLAAGAVVEAGAKTGASPLNPKGAGVAVFGGLKTELVEEFVRLAPALNKLDGALELPKVDFGGCSIF